MVKVLTKFEAKDQEAASKLEVIFHHLSQEVITEPGYISYEVLMVKDLPHYFIYETWASEKDLQQHIKKVAESGYALQATPLISNSPENIILQNLKNE